MKLFDLVTTLINTEVLSDVEGVKRFNQVRSTHIFSEEEDMKIVVKYFDYYEVGGKVIDLKKDSYTIIPNPNGLPLVPPMIEDPENEGELIKDLEAELFDPLTDEYFIWINDETGQLIAAATISRLISRNGAAA